MLACWTIELTSPGSNLLPGVSGGGGGRAASININVHKSYLAGAIMKGCNVCTMALQLSSLVCQYQLVLAGFLQHCLLLPKTDKS